MATGKVVDMKKDMILLGYAADGFPIYFPFVKKKIGELTTITELKSSYKVRSGSRPGFANPDPAGTPIPIYNLAQPTPTTTFDGTFTQDWKWVARSLPGYLDECNGAFGSTPEYPNGTYFYVATRDFPFFPRKFHGSAPDPSFSHAGGDARAVGMQLELRLASLTESGRTLLFGSDRIQFWHSR